MLKNLKKEMAGEDVSVEMLSMLLNVHRNTISNKLEGLSKFSIADGMLIQKTYFPSLSLEYLFKNEIVTSVERRE